MAVSDVPFEEPLVELQRRIDELEAYPEGSGHSREIQQLRARHRRLTRDIYSNLSRWQKTLVARHSDRPHTLDFIHHLMDDWIELHGDRTFGDDPAIVSGLAGFRGRSVAVIGHQKGRGTRERIRRNFGQPRPEGYRKALRIMRLAEKFSLPILTFVDTPGAYPGLGAEERGQAEAIARNLIEMASMRVPILVTITGEGGSGGALALAVGDRVMILEYATYSVISPEGCAAILWKDQSKRREAAEAMRITAPDLLELGIVEEVIEEPIGGAHAQPETVFERTGEALERVLGELEALPVDRLIQLRHQRFRRLGSYLPG